MTTFPRSPLLVKGAIAAINSTTNRVDQTIVFQYNPETLSRTLQAQTIEESGARSEALRLRGAPIETIRLEIEIDATDRLAMAEKTSVASGIYPQLSALETLIYPTVEQISRNMDDAARGVLEIIPIEAPMTLLIWGKRRVLPIRLTDFSINEEAYDINLNPIRAKVSLSLRVLNYDDLPWKQRASKLFLLHHRQKQSLARTGGASSTDALKATQVNIPNL
jgi:Contractile injection system tube protein